jgi:hypothetical protein
MRFAPARPAADDKVERLLAEVERLLIHVGHSIPPEVMVVDEIHKLIREIRTERNQAAPVGSRTTQGRV